MLEWDQPDVDTSSQLMGYVIEKRDVAKKAPTWSYVQKVEARMTEYAVPGLLSGHRYQFRIRPATQYGLGPAIQSEETVTVKTMRSK